jgi:transcriptional regulator with XRE-family HTH domain
MARIVDHPVRVLRLEAGLTQLKLADLAGVARSAVSAVEDGRTLMPVDRVLEVLAGSTNRTVDQVRLLIEFWNKQPLTLSLKPGAQSLLLIPPYLLGQYYSSFGEWRREFASTVTGFASLFRLNPAIVRDFECGKLQRLPDSLGSRLVQGLGVGGDYLIALEGLKREAKSSTSFKRNLGEDS